MPENTMIKRTALTGMILLALIEHARAEPSVQRGKYLVEGVLACGNCHTPRAADTSVIPGRELSGGRTYDLPPFTVTPGNLTSDRETGLGAWSAADVKRLLKEGVRPNGVPVAPMMPVNFTKALTPADLDSVVAYLQSIPPIKNPTPLPVYKKEFRFDPIADAERSYSDDEIANDKLIRGRYLATLAHCLDCHTPTVNGVTDFERDAGKGGKRMGVARVLVPNITSHPTSGIAGWSDEDIKQALAKGRGRDGRTLAYPMPWPFLANLTEADLDSLVVWLRTVPPRE
jgi:mono/diheme cytochrome c family protein